MTLDLHDDSPGKISVEGTVPLDNEDDLSRAYTPGVAEEVEAIAENPDDVFSYTVKGRMAAVVSDGSAVLGMGDVGPEAALPVMEGKSLLIRELGDVSAFPLVLDEKDEEELIRTIERVEPGFGFIMLEDISSPKCFHVERELTERLDVPVFHDDQHGAAITILAGLTNALEVVEKELADVEITIIGAGAAGIATAELLLEEGAERITMVDRPGIIHGEMDDLNDVQRDIAARTNPSEREGSLSDALEGADVMIGLSAGGIVTGEMVESMAEDPVVFALANPDPEIRPETAEKAGAAVVGTGRSDHPNQINNVLAFPGVVKGCIRCQSSDITSGMKIAAAEAIAAIVENPRPENVIPSPLNPDVAPAVARAVMREGEREGVCRVSVE